MIQKEKAENLTMKWTLLLLVLWTITFSGDAASNSLVSSVEEDGRESACPGEVVRYTCTVNDISNPLVGSTIWSGSAFDCTLVNDVITLQHSQFGGGTQGTCGSLTAQSEGRDGTCFTSVLTLPEADEGMNGKIINCTLSGVVTAGSDTLDVASCPAPTITITEVTPESVSVSIDIDDYPEDTLLCSYTLMGRVMDESGEIIQTFTTTNATSVIVDGLNLCANSYTFEVSVMCGNVVSPMTTMEFNANLTSLYQVGNVSSDCNFITVESLTLLWDAPDNAPDNCIVNYQIEVEVDGSIQTNTTADNSTSYDLNLLPREEYIVTVAPITVRIGVVETSRSNLVTIPQMQALPAPVITVTELTPVSARVSVDVIDYPDESERCITNFTVEETSDAVPIQFSESGLSVNISLDLCTTVYTFQGRVMSNSVPSNLSEGVPLNSNLPTLDRVTNVRSEDNFINWEAPANAPDNCIVNYQLAVSGFSMFNTTTDSSSTTIPISSLSLDLTTCAEHNVTVAPITVRIGVVETSRSDPHRLIAVDRVTSVRSEDNFVTLEWDAPANAPPGCIMNYQIRVELDGMTTMTDDDSTSYNIAESSLFPREEHNVTVAPITVSFGLVETSRSDPFTIPQMQDTIKSVVSVLASLPLGEKKRGRETGTETIKSEPAASESDDSVIIIIIVVILVIVGTTIVVNLNLILIDIYRPGEEEASKEPPCKIWVTIILVLTIAPIPFVIYLYCCRYKKRDEKPSKERPCKTWVTIILVLVVVTIPFVIYLYCCRDKKQGCCGRQGGEDDVDTEMAVRSMTRDTGAAKPEKKGKKKKKKEKKVQPAEEVEYSRLARPGVMSPHSPQEAGEEYDKINLGQVTEPGGEEYSELRHQGARQPQAVPNPEDPMYSHL